MFIDFTQWRSHSEGDLHGNRVQNKREEELEIKRLTKMVQKKNDEEVSIGLNLIIIFFL